LAEESASCVALLEPPVMLPPAIETGALPLTAFWSLFARAPLHCSVFAICAPAWKPPAPPMPAPPSWPSLPVQKRTRLKFSH